MNNEKQSNWRFLDAIWENHNLVQMFTGATFREICIFFTHQNLHLRVYYQVHWPSKLEREGLKDDFVSIQNLLLSFTLTFISEAFSPKKVDDQRWMCNV